MKEKKKLWAMFPDAYRRILSCHLLASRDGWKSLGLPAAVQLQSVPSVSHGILPVCLSSHVDTSHIRVPQYDLISAHDIYRASISNSDHTVRSWG